MGIKTTKTLVIEEDKNSNFEALCTDMRKTQSEPSCSLRSFSDHSFVPSSGRPGSPRRRRFHRQCALWFPDSDALPFVSYTMQFFDPVMQLARILAELQQAQASAERIFSLIETEPDITDSREVVEKYGTLLSPKKDNWESLEGDIEFQDVTFKYQEGEVVLENFNLRVKKGTSVALVGETGSGKTTIVNLICRFWSRFPAGF